MTSLAPDLSAVLDRVVDSVTVQDSTGRFVYANAVAAQELGFETPEKLLATVPAELMARYVMFDEHGAPFPWERLPGRLVLAGQEASEVLVQFQTTATGTRRWMHVHASPLIGADGSRFAVNLIRDVTDQLTTEQALREREARLRAILAAIPDLLFVQAPDGTYLEYRAEDANQLFVAPPQFLGKTPADVLPPDLAASVMAALKHTASSGELTTVDYALPIGGEERHYEARIVRLDASRLLSIVRDLTDRVRAETALEEHRRFEERVATASPAILYMYDYGVQRTIYVNQAVTRLLGYTTVSLEGMARTLWTTLLHPEDRERLPALAAEIDTLADGEVVEQSYRLRHADGQWRWLAARVTVLTRGTDGRPQLVVGAAVDVTELRRAEEALRASEAQLRLALDNAAMGTWDWSVGSGWVAWSESSGPLYGLPADTPGVAIETFFARIHPDDRARVAAEHERRVADGADYAVEYRVVWPDGTIHWLERKGRAVEFDADGRVTRFLGVTMDITARKQGETTLRELSRRLLSAQDEERRRLARELHDGVAQDVFALSVALASLERAQSHLSEKAQTALSEAKKLAEQVLRGLRTQAYLLHPPLLDMSGLAPALREYAGGLGRRGALDVDSSGVDNLGRLPADVETALFRVAQEALTNVARHAKTDHATLTLRSDGDTVELIVADRGKGFAADSVSPKTPIVGVGIPGMRERLHQIGGELNVESGSSGSTVTARIPVTPGSS